MLSALQSGHAMLIQPIDYFLLAWFVLAGASTLYVAFDQYWHNPEPQVMKWGFILVTLYMGPIGLLMYVLAIRNHGRANTRNSSDRYGSKASAQQSTALLAMLPGSSLRPLSLLCSGFRCGSI
jgi:hypothetical protein